MRYTSLSLLTVLSLVACTHSLKDNTNHDVATAPPSTSCDHCNSPLDGGSSGSPDAGQEDAGQDSSVAPKTCGVGIDHLCQLGEACGINADCESQACNYRGQCITEKSCVAFYGGNSCGSNESEIGGTWESCCKALPVNGYVDPTHPDKQVYLDKYEITAGRMRAFTNAVIAEMGKPDFKGWVSRHRPEIWNDEWTKFLPSDYEGDSILIPRLNLGDPRHDHQTQDQAGPGVIIPPATDQVVSTGLNHQFNGQVFLDTHGNNCGTFAGAFGFPDYYYPPNVLKAVGEVPRSDALDLDGHLVKAQDALDSKPMNCATGLMFQLFCSFDGGELASSEVLDFITQTPSTLGNTSGCGTQFDDHGIILGGDPLQVDPSIRSGGKCPNLSSIVATFDAGDKLPTVFLGGVEISDPNKNPGNFLNQHIYWYPNYPAADTSEKIWQIAAPGRTVADNIDGFMDLSGNLNENVLETQGGKFGGLFGVKYRGIGYGSERSDLNNSLMPGETVIRLARAEAKSALVGARCKYYK